MGVESSLIAIAVVAVIVFIAILVYVILDRIGFFSNKGGGVPSYRYPCLVSDDCGANWGLQNYVCDPKLKQCRIRSYQYGSCTTDTDCLAITPHCIQPPRFGIGRACSHTPYTTGDVYGDPVFSCNSGLVVNPTWNFCQFEAGGHCNTSDDCAQGACSFSRCQFLTGYDVCTVESSYGTNQCALGLDCVPNPKHRLDPYRCQPHGIAPGANGAYCTVDKDCDNGDCYRADSSDPIGICASHEAFVGMACRNGAECAQGLECSILSGQTTGTCTLTDPAAQRPSTDLTHCPANNYTRITTAGCAGTADPVPCSSGDICRSQCNLGRADVLIMGFLDAKNTWNQIYPPFGLNDRLHFLAPIFNVNSSSGVVTLNPRFTLLISTNLLTSLAVEDYPTITLTSPPPPAPQPSPPAQILDIKSCEPLLRDFTLLSSFSSQSTATVIFKVEYDPNASPIVPANWSVQAMIQGSSIAASAPLLINMLSNDLFADYYVNKDPNANPYVHYDTIYVNCNYHGRTNERIWPVPAGETNYIPAPWDNPPMHTIQRFLVPPPLLPTASVNPLYLNNCLRLGVADETREIFMHFLYYPATGEKVISWKFSVMPTRIGGGLTSLVGLYEVEQSPGGPRRLIVSTLSLYTMTTIQDSSTQLFAEASGSMWTQRNMVYSNPSSSLNVYASVYSFVLIDFAADWPFTTKLLGPPSTQHDTAGLCNVTFTDTSHGDTQFVQLNGANTSSIPGIPGQYAVFTPRACTRVQAVSTVRTAQWTSTVLFGGPNPSLLDSDIAVLGTAGSSCIVGLTLTYRCLDSQIQTLLLTMRFGDAMPTSFYSVPNLNAAIQAYAYPTRMYTFFLTPQPEESGGGSVTVPGFPPHEAKFAFPTPQVALAPVTSNDISSWVTPPFFIDHTSGAVIVDREGQYVEHYTRTPWGSEVFTASLIPAVLAPPVRFFRMPVKNQQLLSTQGGDDVWVWGRDVSTGSLRFVPLFFDNLGTVISHMGSEFWLSSAGVTCPPTASQAVAGMDHTFQLNDGARTPYQFSPWGIKPDAQVVFRPDPSPPFNMNPVQLTGRMCQTQGYQDGLLYRARPYLFPEGAAGIEDNLPAGVKSILNDSAQNQILVLDAESLALALSSGPGTTYQQALPLIGIGSIAVLLGVGGSVHPTVTGVFTAGKEFTWAGSESGTPILTGGYRTLPCPVNPRAFTSGVLSSYPAGCLDYFLSQDQISERKSLPICIIYRSISTSILEVRLLNVTAARSPAATTLLSNTLVQTNGGLATMSALYAPAPPDSLAGAVLGYPGFNGGPVFVYSPCE